MPIINPGFEDGDTGWAKGANWTIVQNSGFSRDGVWAARWDGGNGSNSEIINDVREPVSPGQSVTASMYGSVNGANSSQGGVHVILVWYNASNTRIGDTAGAIITGGGTAMRQSTVTATAPSGATRVSVGARAYRNSNPRPYFVDTASWNIVRDRTIELIQPTDGQEFSVEQQIPLRVTIGGTAPAITSVSYLVDGVEERVNASAPYGVNLSPLAVGSYELQARLNLVDGTTVLSNVVNIEVVTTPTPPTLREYKASNAYTYLIGENFINLGGAMPPTARVLGVEVLVDYTMEVLVRSKDVGIADPAEANNDVAFDIVNGGTVEAVLLRNDGTSYTQLGAPMSNTVPINRVDFSVEEDGLSEGKRWTTFTGGEGQVVVGAEDQRFGLLPEFGSTFIDYGVGIRFTPNLATVPSYADAGDASYRFNVQAFKIRVYFDAGSVEYYFASPDKSQVLKGTLAAYYVYTGNFATSDASGVLQITSDLEQMDGAQRWIGSDWTIHSSYPPTDNNQIGEVGEIADASPLGMKYNGLPTQQQVRDNRSRYEFKTENFYGSEELNSMYGVHGLPRAFAYNGDFFYKIYTQADAEKDSPRHVANHHGHLALGFYGGRVDISVAGEPYNFSGVDGASSWAFGDKVVGLLPLSGTILGVFGAKSVWGISGTTVDNFATQVISPNMGAVEYTITDMGFPVYANSYGIYTLNQTQQYGDYLGQPMSQDISPWLRPRLIRKLTSEKEVVCAFPVRSKNQYRLCFSDGFVTSMTLNGQQVPTFSFQKYFYTPEDTTLPSDLFSYPSIVPAAISSELDEAGEERIHVAPYAIRDEASLLTLSLTGLLPEGLVEEDYEAELTAVNFNSLVSAFIVQGTLPEGLTLSLDIPNNKIIISGVTLEDGDFPITVQAYETTGRSAKYEGVVTITSVPVLTLIANGTSSVNNNIGATSRKVGRANFDTPIDSAVLDTTANLMTVNNSRVLAFQGTRVAKSDNLGSLFTQYNSTVGGELKESKIRLGNSLFLARTTAVVRSLNNGDSFTSILTQPVIILASNGTRVMAVNSSTVPYFATATGNFGGGGARFDSTPEAFTPTAGATPYQTDGVRFVMGGRRWGGAFGVNEYIPGLAVSANNASSWTYPTVGTRLESEGSIIGLSHNFSGRWIAVTSLGKVYTSDDTLLVNWVYRGILPGWTGSANECTIRWNGERFIILLLSPSTTVFCTSLDGATWETLAHPFGNTLKSFDLITP